MAKHMKNVVEPKGKDNVVRVPKHVGGAGGGDPRVNAHACVTRDKKKYGNKRACRGRVRED